VSEYSHVQNIRKLEILKELISILSSREPIDYNQPISSNQSKPSIDELIQLNEQKEEEVKALQKAWEELEDLLFNDLQITLQEKNQLVALIGNMRKEEKTRKKQKRVIGTTVWRAE
jgi:hypothetical protein